MIGNDGHSDLGAGDGSRGVQRYDPLVRLRGFRVRGERGRGIAEDCEGLMRSLKRVSGDQSAVGSAWDAAAPDDLRDMGWVMGLKGGRLEIGVESAGGRHRVDRWLRSGGLELLREMGRVRIKSVVLRIEARDGSRTELD